MAPYARTEVVFILVIGALVTPGVAWLAGWWALLPAVLAVALLSFYRDPPRRIPSGDNIVVAPADGRIVAVERGHADADGGAVLRIMIFLSVFDVHVNRAPCAGRVKDVTYCPGAFLNALSDAADTKNECNSVVLIPTPPLPGPVRVRQIAGVLARRIVCAVHPGDSLTAGQRLGMIKLGSRTELCLPESPAWEVLVRPGQHVRGGATVLARLDPARLT